MNSSCDTTTSVAKRTRRRLELLTCIIGATSTALPPDILFKILEMANLVSMGRRAVMFQIHVHPHGRVYYKDGA